MSAPVFATRWQFLFSWLLIGVDRGDGTWAGGPQPDGTPSVVVWTDPSLVDAPSERFQVAQLTARQLVQTLPAGVGVTVNPGREDSMLVDAAEMDRLRGLCHPFPGGLPIEFKTWTDLPASVAAGIAAAVEARPFITEVRAFLYTIGDSPYLGCLAYESDGGTESQESTTAELERVLSSSADLAALDVATVNIVGLIDLPAGVRDDLPPETLLYRR